MNITLSDTVVAAIILFTLKEVFEAVRRYQAESRKKTAYRRLLAEECEKNNWSIRSLKNIFASIEGDYETHNFEIDLRNKREYLKIKAKDGGSGSNRPIPDAHDGVFKKIYLELAAVDNKLFEFASKAYTGIAEIEHIRAGLILHSTRTDEDYPDELISFAPYAQTTLKNAHEAIQVLYRECTGNELVTHKIRTYV
jgi:hypothetical protein